MDQTYCLVQIQHRILQSVGMKLGLPAVAVHSLLSVYYPSLPPQVAAGF